MLAWSDSYCRQILTSIADSPKTVREINDELGFSKNRIYRKLHLLKKIHRIRISGKISKNGSKNFRYQSKMRYFFSTMSLKEEYNPTNNHSK